ncbi:hypothetical protein CBR_g48252 [Chara braunii]|uniref:Peptidase A2 domain-containing protein n=1 Tax=Chara braunii TaxID=69332 RepID=A0A388M2L0_CHABU|nr:hypothetical protein CBR_g48252 [Chara braunii]|eukprot:GBG88722.1 hypothetical protein CBR_g48252 [Chara braunii]
MYGDESMLMWHLAEVALHCVVGGTEAMTGVGTEEIKENQGPMQPKSLKGEWVNWNSLGGMRRAVIMLNGLEIAAIEDEPVVDIIWNQLPGRGLQVNFILENDGRDRVNATTRLGTAGRRIICDIVMKEVAEGSSPQAEPEAGELEKVYGNPREEEPTNKVTAAKKKFRYRIPILTMPEIDDTLSKLLGTMVSVSFQTMLKASPRLLKGLRQLLTRRRVEIDENPEAPEEEREEEAPQEVANLQRSRGDLEDLEKAFADIRMSLPDREGGEVMREPPRTKLSFHALPVGKMKIQIGTHHTDALVDGGAEITLIRRDFATITGCMFKKEVLTILHCLKTFLTYLFGRRFILRIDPTNVAGALKNYMPIDPTVGRWVGFIWQFDYKIERIAGIRNEADGWSRVCITPEGVEDVEPIDAFLEFEGGTLAVDNEMMDEDSASGELLIRTLEKGAPAVVAELREGSVTTRGRKEERDSWRAIVGPKEELIAMAVEGGRETVMSLVESWGRKELQWKANAPVERGHRTLKNTIAKLAADRLGSWPRLDDDPRMTTEELIEARCQQVLKNEEVMEDIANQVLDNRMRDKASKYATWQVQPHHIVPRGKCGLTESPAMGRTHLPRGILTPSSSPTWQVRRWRWERDGDAEVATPSRRQGGVLAPSSSPTGKCGGGDGSGKYATWQVQPHHIVPRGKCGGGDGNGKYATWQVRPHHIVPRGKCGGGDAEVAMGVGSGSGGGDSGRGIGSGIGKRRWRRRARDREWDREAEVATSRWQRRARDREWDREVKVATGSGSGS